VIDADGREVIPPRFDQSISIVKKLDNGYAVVYHKRNHGVIDSNGNIIGNICYGAIDNYSEGLFAVRSQMK